MLIHQKHAAGEENSSIMVGIFVCLCLASKKPSEREFFVPAGTDLGVKLLRDSYIGAVHLGKIDFLVHLAKMDFVVEMHPTFVTYFFAR
jgi:hypothetical protein